MHLRSIASRLNAGESPVFIGFDEKSEFVAEAKWLERQFGDRRFSFRTSSQTTQAAAARASYGIALLPKYVVETHEPRLVEITLKGNLPERDVWLIIRRDLTKIPRVRAVADYLIELFRRQRRLLAS
jgi:DNA-binding transcriptional LysR family regulator